MLRVVTPGALSTIQDSGRPGFGHLGVPRGGAVDGWSLGVANRLLGNDPDAAAVEMTLLGAELAVEVDGVIGLAGADMAAVVIEEGRSLATGASHRLRAGTTIRFVGAERGVRAYLALPGGIDVPVVLGSRSTCLAGGFGGFEGRPLAAGDRLRPGADARALEPDRRWPSSAFDPTDPAAPVRVIPVPDARGVHADALDALLRATWTVSPVGDRSGVRLDGPSLPASPDAGALVSTGLLPGTVQLLPSGQPVVLLADGPTIGGYPVAAVVIAADLPVVAQRPPGEPLHFVAVDVELARDAAQALRAELADGGLAR